MQTDGVHSRDNVRNASPEALSEAVKILKGEYCIRAINEHKMDRCVLDWFRVRVLQVATDQPVLLQCQDFLKGDRVG